MDKPSKSRKARRVIAAGISDIDFDMLPGLVGFHLRFAQNAVVDDFVATLAEHEITPTQFSSLTLIAANPGQTQTTISKAVGIERSSTVAIVDQLEKRGLVLRTPVDRRSNALTLTSKGAALLDIIKPKVRQHDDRISRGLSADEKTLLVDLLDRLAVAQD